MDDDAIRERHGVRALPGPACAKEVLLRERDVEIVISLGVQDAALTPWQARYLAAKLYRLSRRIRQRQEQPQ